jgi:hypothetical protein
MEKSLMSEEQAVSSAEETQSNSSQQADYARLAKLAGVDSQAAASLDHMSEEQIEDFIDDLDDRRSVIQSVHAAKCKLQDVAGLKLRLKMAHATPRCGHIKADGNPCGSAAMKGEQFCYFHGEARARNELQKTMEVPVLENAQGIQLAIMRVCTLLTNRTIDEKTARAIFAGLDLAQKVIK